TSGKVQRHVLAAQYAAGEFDAQIALLADLRAAREGGAAPSSEIEEKLIELLGRLGSASRVGVHDNLFEIGFSSSKMLELFAQVDALWPDALQIAEVYDHPTISALAKRIEQKRRK